MQAAASRPRFDRAAIIYNPASGRVQPRMVERLRSDLAREEPNLPVTVLRSEFAGNARELAAQAAAGPGSPLIVSVSGDGGFNEVVNGVMAADPHPAVVCAVMAGGNANDHRRSTRSTPMIDAIVHGPVRRIDLLRITLTTASEETTIYAHSYAGLGLTASMAIGLDTAGGLWQELVAVLRTFVRLAPVRVVTDGRGRSLDSLILANIPDIAKFGRIGEGRPDDGVFEVVTWPTGARWRLALMAVRAASVGLRPQPGSKDITFSVAQDCPFQVDGEIRHLAAGTQIRCVCIPQVLATLG